MRAYETTSNFKNPLHRLKNINVVAEDQDGTNVKDLAVLQEVVEYCLNPKNLYTKPEIIPWGFKGLLSYAKEGSDALSHIESTFFKILGKEETDELFHKAATRGKLLGNILPGVTSMHQTLSNESNNNIYINSRNDPDVINYTAQLLNIPRENIFGREKKDKNTKNKGDSLVEIVKLHKSLNPDQPINLLIRDDTMSGYSAVEAAYDLKSSQIVNDVIVQAIGNGNFSKQKLTDIITTPNQNVFAQELYNIKNGIYQ